MLGLPPWVSLVAVLLAAAVARLLPTTRIRIAAIGPLLDRRWAPAVFGALTGAITLWVWRSLSRPPVLHDESAYLLQAELFARLRWVGNARPFPEFFQQLYVLVDPVLASKYPPGHSLVLAMGAVVGLPALPVVLMDAWAGALVFALARRVGGPSVAILTWLVWMTSFPVIYYHANYMSQGTSSLTWLLAWWGLARWRDAGSDSRGRRWLVVATAAATWCAITRPLTGLALGVVVGAVILRRSWCRPSWRELAPALAVGAAIVALLPLWSWRTTGDPTLAPLTVYTREFVPFDKPGFGVAPGSKPSPRLPRDQWLTSASFYQEHARHTVAALPAAARARLEMIATDAWHEWRGGLKWFAVVGLLLLPAEGLVALAAFALHFLLYLSYAHPARWSIYYIEGAPVLAFVTALGIARVLWWASSSRRFPNPPPSSARDLVRRWWTGRRDFLTVALPPANQGRARAAIVVLIVAALVAGSGVIRQVRSQIDADHAYHHAFGSLLGRISDARAVVFVRYGAKHLDGLSLVRNVPELGESRIWTVYDRGQDNQRLLRWANDRAPYLFDEASWTLQRLQRPAQSTRTSGVASASTPAATAWR